MYLRINAFALSGRTNDNTIIPRVSLRLPWAMRLLGFQPVHYRWYLRASACWLSVRFVCLYCALCERLGAIGGTGAPVGGLAAHLQFEHTAAHDVVVE